MSSPTRAAARSDEGKGAQASLLIAALAFAVTVGTVQLTVLVPLLPSLQSKLGLSLEVATWTVTATLLAGAVTMPLLTGLGDRYGQRRVMLGSLSLLIVGSAVAAQADGPALLLAGRVLQGSAAAMLPLAIGQVRALLPPDRMATGIGVLSATIGVGNGGGMILAGVAGDHRTVFWLLAGLSALSFGLLLVAVHDVGRVGKSPDRARGPRLDVPGALLLGATLLCLLLALSRVNAWGWPSVGVIGLLAGAAVSTVGWLLWTHHTPDPLVDVTVLVDPRTISATLASLLLGFGLFDFITSMSTFLQTERDASVLDVGLYLLPTVALMMSVSIATSALLRHFSSAALVAVGSMLIAAASMCGMLIGGPAAILSATTLLGVGTGLGYAAVGTMAVAHVPLSKTAAASGLNALVRLVGASLAGAVTAAILGGSDPARFDVGFMVAGVATGIAAVAAALHHVKFDRRDNDRLVRHD